MGLVSNLFAGVGEAHAEGGDGEPAAQRVHRGGRGRGGGVRVTCVVGKSMLMPVRALEAIGGFAAGAQPAGRGPGDRRPGPAGGLLDPAEPSRHRERELAAGACSWFLNRHSRWYKIRRRLALPAFMAEPAANLATVGLVWAFSGESGIAWGGLLVLVGLGMVRDAVQTRWLRGSFPKLRHLLFSPVKDILLLSVWFDAILNRRVRWRGHSFLIGRMTRLRLRRRAASSPAAGPPRPAAPPFGSRARPIAGATTDGSRSSRHRPATGLRSG